MAGVLTLVLVWRFAFGLARASAALAVAAVIAGWAAAQEPRLLPGLTVRAAAADRATLLATVIGVAVGAAVLVPSLALLYTLVLRGRLDAAALGDESGVAVPDRARRAPASRLAWGFAAAALVAGVGLLIFARPAWALGIGALSLLACAITVFALTAAPD
jgi:cytochrome d ubiquinol oxidase subunit II